MVKGRHEAVPDVVDITLYYCNESKWMLHEPKLESIKFRVLGKALGPIRWRPHLIQTMDPLPIQGKKEFNEMLNILRESISNNIELECVPITKDLLDDVSGKVA